MWTFSRGKIDISRAVRCRGVGGTGDGGEAVTWRVVSGGVGRGGSIHNVVLISTLSSLCGPHPTPPAPSIASP